MNFLVLRWKWANPETNLWNLLNSIWTGKEEKEVLQILTQVSVTKREQEINLDEADFDEKKKINKRKKLILQGLEPEEADRQLERAAAASSSQPRRKKRRRPAKEDAAEPTGDDEAAGDS